MRPSHSQHTLRETIEFNGVGLHTGAACRVRVRPQAANTGLRFRLGDAVTFPAHAAHVVETRRATVLGMGEHRVSTVEHLLSALFAFGVDNALIEVDGPEIPVTDGSAANFCAWIAQAGLESQRVPRTFCTIDAPMAFRDGDALLLLLPSDEFRVRFVVDYASPVGQQFFEGTIDAEMYEHEIAPARTFGYLHEVEALLANGLARGGSLENALVFAPDGPMTPLRWPNEVVRHKVLDLIGDFALLGAWPHCEVVSFKSGHRLHVKAVTEIAGGAEPARAVR